MAIHTVTIVGVGLIGGSFGLALRARGFEGRILGVSSPPTLRAAIARGAIDEGVSFEEGVSQADLVYLSQPISRILESLAEVRRLAPPHALVTDAGSTKLQVVRRAQELFTGEPSFVGGHPMAGKAQRGVERSDARLFEGATYVLTPLDLRLPESPVAEEFTGWLERIGSRVLLLTAAVHDEIVTWTSHLPQLLSSALASCVLEKVDVQNHLQVAGPGFRDMTRLAESPYEIWKDIFSTNRENLEAALTFYIHRLERYRESLAPPRLDTEFEAAQRLRKKLVEEPES